MERAELVEALKAHAYDKYDGKGGWDFLIETWTDEEINAELDKYPGVTTLLGAKRHFGAFLKNLADYRADIQGA